MNNIENIKDEERVLWSSYQCHRDHIKLSFKAKSITFGPTVVHVLFYNSSFC